jgi:hypothetical protein
MFCSMCNRCALAKLWFQIVRLAIFRVNGVLLTGVSTYFGNSRTF